jgi:hypothetical protein
MYIFKQVFRIVKVGDNKLAVNYLKKFVIKVLFMTPNYVTITIYAKFHTI